MPMAEADARVVYVDGCELERRPECRGGR
jgi:hypothetical protein